MFEKNTTARKETIYENRLFSGEEGKAALYPY
jgi:hypothetical protein